MRSSTDFRRLEDWGLQAKVPLWADGIPLGKTGERNGGEGHLLCRGCVTRHLDLSLALQTEIMCCSGRVPGELGDSPGTVLFSGSLPP